MDGYRCPSCTNPIRIMRYGAYPVPGPGPEKVDYSVWCEECQYEGPTRETEEEAVESFSWFIFQSHGEMGVVDR